MKTPHTYLMLPLLCLFLLFTPLAATAQASGSARQANAATEVTMYDMDSSYAEVVSVHRPYPGVTGFRRVMRRRTGLHPAEIACRCQRTVW